MVRPRCVLLDAGPVIALHEAGVWERFCDAFEVVIPETVAEDEALFHSRDELSGDHTPISVRADESSGRVRVIAATSAELVAVARRFTGDFASGLHDGELEGLALLTERNELEEHVLCTGDGAAIQAAMMVGLDERCLPLDGLLDSAGIRQPLPRWFTRDFFEEHRRLGLDNRLNNFGLADTTGGGR